MSNEIVLKHSVLPELTCRESVNNALDVLCRHFFLLEWHDQSAVVFSPAAFIDGVTLVAKGNGFSTADAFVAEKIVF